MAVGLLAVTVGLLDVAVTELLRGLIVNGWGVAMELLSLEMALLGVAVRFWDVAVGCFGVAVGF